MITNEMISWLNNDENVEEFENIFIIPNDGSVSDEEKKLRMSVSTVNVARRRELIDKFAERFYLEDNIPQAVSLIGEWQDLQ